MDSSFGPPRTSSSRPHHSRHPTVPSQAAPYLPAGHSRQRGIHDSLQCSGHRPRDNGNPFLSGPPSAETTLADFDWDCFLRETLPHGTLSDSQRRRLDTIPLAHRPRFVQYLTATASGAARRAQYQAVASHTRKRESSISDTQGESSKRLDAGTRPSTTLRGSSTASAIDLTTSPHMASRSLPTRPRSPPLHRSSSSIRLPLWQPDVDVSRCPICRADFGFLFRKHHCRKCGKVVCDNCSRHRITIPKKYIVQPPLGPSTSGFGSVFTSSPPTPQNGTSSARTPGTGYGLPPDTSDSMSGSEEVRVCNPCVPDPNLSPPPQMPNDAQAMPFPAFASLHSTNGVSRTRTGGNLLPPPIPNRRGSGYSPFLRTPSDQIPPSNDRFHFPTQDSSSSGPFMPRVESLNYSRPIPSHRRSTLDSTGHPHRTSSNHPSFMNTPIDWSQSGPHRSQRSSMDTAFHRPGMHNPSPSSSASSHSHPRPPRREISEEDECPVCGRELPALGPHGDETARTKHIDSCISLHSFSASSAVPPRPSQARQSAFAGASRAGFTATSAPSTAPVVPPVLPRRAGMVVYAATEKDCIGEDGEAQECVICFEEFENGDEMGRLECWCKFHRVSDCLLLSGLGAGGGDATRDEVRGRELTVTDVYTAVVGQEGGRQLSDAPIA